MKAKTINNFQRNINPKEAMNTGLSTIEDKLEYICMILNQYGLNAQWKPHKVIGTEYEIYEKDGPNHMTVYATYDTKKQKFMVWQNKPYETDDVFETINWIFQAIYPEIDKTISEIEINLENIKRIKDYLDNDKTRN